MDKMNIMLVCSAGMSTSMLVTAVDTQIKEQNLEAEVFAKPSTEAVEYAETEDVSVLLLGPQVEFMKSGFQESLQDKNIPIDVIDSRDYGTVNGEKVLQQALELVNR